jgi:pyruvate kinase
MRRTKIVCTLGPATDDPALLERLVAAGANVVRLNFSHGDAADHRRRAQQVRDIAAALGTTVAVLGDLQGPKIRIARFADGPVELVVGEQFDLVADLGREAGNGGEVGIDYPALPDEVGAGDRLLLDDGRVVLEVVRVRDRRVETVVIVGGQLSDSKGINRAGGGLSAAALTDKDREDIRLAADICVDYLAVSFVRSGADLAQARQLLVDAGGNAGIVAKVERAEAATDHAVLDDIIRESDVLMVARGDLGVEIGDAELIAVQKYLIERARQLNRVTITATQMMESMIENTLPTRAEVFDVANAVLDGTDAVMLSAETAVGRYPVEAVAAMHRIIEGAERYPGVQNARRPQLGDVQAIDESIARACMYTANRLSGVTAIISLTESGNTPLLMSRISSTLPVFAFTRNTRTENRVALYRGVQPIPFDLSGIPEHEVNRRLLDELLRRGVVESGDLVISSRGELAGVQGGTNTMTILRA